ncbi:Spy/CpxP family protein refolding chaperone [Candidatus Methylobacter oryzae]|uniref:Periplasmic heavy metal sensor n=1 Tax=Candidatus Methylobacter oryzae TaxID=2497749 RepID=A0ABY3CGU4_9GAMM|nr:hypothetical protein [Candidatus Methylobacter oryzae]TRX03047.1 hypothetical protein EKO24_001830 [Candidatus Methylobacter oryzae]
MNKKIIIIALAVLLPFTAMAAGNETGNHEGRRGEKIKQLTKELGLSAEQQSRLETIFQQHHEKLKALREEKHKLMEGVLTSEQIAKYNELKKERHLKKQRKHHQGGDKNTQVPM